MKQMEYENQEKEIVKVYNHYEYTLLVYEDRIDIYTNKTGIRQFVESTKDNYKKVYAKIYYKHNKEKKKEYQKKYYETNKEERLEYQKEYNKENHEKVKKTMNNCYWKKRDYYLEKNKKHYHIKKSIKL